MERSLIAILSILILFPPLVHSKDNCEGKKELDYILKYHLRFLTFTKYNDDCSQIVQGDFNNDGRMDYAAILTELKPFVKYANGDDWYHTYVVAFLNGDLPYNKYQPIFIRTDGNKPKRFSIHLINTQEGDDLGLTKDKYSYTRYKWTPTGFKAIEHKAD